MAAKVSSAGRVLEPRTLHLDEKIRADAHKVLELERLLGHGRRTKR